MPPLFSIVIPTYNRAKLLGEALQSALAQSFSNYEVIVRDNASTDSTMDLAKSCTNPRVRFFRNEHNVGAERNFELIVRDAAGDFLVLLQDDDLLHPEFLGRAAAAIERNPEIVAYAAYSAKAPTASPQYWFFNDAVYGPELPVNWDQTGPRYWPGPLASVQCLLRTGFWFPVLAVRREHCLRYLPVDLSLGNAIDRFLTGCIATNGPVAVEGWIAGVSRWHAGQLTKQFGNYDRFIVLTARKLIDFYESNSIDWQGLVREWLGHLNQERRRQLFLHAMSLPYAPALQECLAQAVAHGTGQDPRQLLRPRSKWKGILKDSARDLTPPLIWRFAGRTARKLFGYAPIEERV
jgi:glycosyltransferase involved in cell wall biosynthesis